VRAETLAARTPQTGEKKMEPAKILGMPKPEPEKPERRKRGEGYRSNGRKSLETRADGSQYVPGVPELDKFFEGYWAVDVTPDRIREFITKRQNDGAANSTINRSLAALRRMFNLAVHDQKLRDVPYIQLLKEPPARKGFLEHEAYQRLYLAAPEYLRPIVATGYYTDMRRGRNPWPDVGERQSA
jgi:integrase